MDTVAPYDLYVECYIVFLLFRNCASLSGSLSVLFMLPSPLQNKLKLNQKVKVNKFISLTQTGEQTAIRCLQDNEWKLDLSCDTYFQNPDLYYRELDKKKIEQLFNVYRDPSDPNKINSDGVERFLEDLHLNPESKLVLIIAWRFKAEAQCEFTRNEFINGFYDLGVDSIEKLKEKLPRLEQELKDPGRFKDFYQFTFNYAKDPGQKGLDLEMAIAYWNIVLNDRFKFLDLWCKFLVVCTMQLPFLVPEVTEIMFLSTGKSQAINTERYVEFAP